MWEVYVLTKYLLLEKIENAYSLHLHVHCKCIFSRSNISEFQLKKLWLRYINFYHYNFHGGLLDKWCAWLTGQIIVILVMSDEVYVMSNDQ